MARDVVFYENSDGESELRDALRSINNADPRHFRHIKKKIELLSRMEDINIDATRVGLVKRPTGNIYVLIVKGGGGFAFRLPFFVPQCKGGELIVFTHCEQRRGLDANYDALVSESERLRQDWIQRNC